MGARIVQRAFVVVYWSVRAQHVRGTCASWWDVGRNVFVLRAFGEMCDVRIFLGTHCSARVCRLFIGVRLCWLVGDVFVGGRVWKAIVFFACVDALFSARLSFVSWSVRAQHVRGTCASWWDVGRNVFVLRAFGEMCDVRIFLGGRIVQRAFVVCLLGRARAARAGVYCFRGGSDVF